MGVNTSESAVERDRYAVPAAIEHVGNNLRRTIVFPKTSTVEYDEPEFLVAVRFFGAKTEVPSAAAVAHEVDEVELKLKLNDVFLQCLSQRNNMMTDMNQKPTEINELYSTILGRQDMTIPELDIS